MTPSIQHTLMNSKVSARLRARLWLFIVITAGLCAYLIYNVWLGDATWWSALIAFVIGLAVGVPLGRLRTVRWHETREEVISKMDLIGGVALIAYIILDGSRDWLLGHWFSGADLTTIAFAVLAGALLGRLYGMHISIQRVLGVPKRPR